jgi:hypothetical protein
MRRLTLLLAFFLSAAGLAQPAPEEAAAPEAPPKAAEPAPAPAAIPAATPSASPAATAAPAAARTPTATPTTAASPAAPAAEPASGAAATPLPNRQADNDKLQRGLEKMRRLPPDQAVKESARLQRELGPIKTPENPTPAEVLRGLDLPKPPLGADGEKPTTEIDWVRDEARIFFTHMLAGDARSLVDHAGFPFQLEERRVGTPEELMQEWLKALRSKRTDLMTLYGVEVLTPADMEKKYGKPPARLSSFPWKGPKTYLAVANISGRAAVALVKDVGGGDWKIVGYHD